MSDDDLWVIPEKTFDDICDKLRRHQEYCIKNNDPYTSRVIERVIEELNREAVPLGRRRAIIYQQLGVVCDNES